jgi:hypothetical protein
MTQYIDKPIIGHVTTKSIDLFDPLTGKPNGTITGHTYAVTGILTTCDHTFYITNEVYKTYSDGTPEPLYIADILTESYTPL